MSILIAEIAADHTLELAFKWLCKRRQDLSHNNDVWNLRRCWHQIKPQLKQILISDRYCFSPLSEVRLDDATLECWTAQDSLVLKAMAIVLGKHLGLVISVRCTHVVGHGGANKAVRKILQRLSPDCHVMKSDIKGYYASIDHRLLFGLLSDYVSDRHVLHLLWQYLKRTVCYGGNYRCANDQFMIPRN